MEEKESPIPSPGPGRHPGRPAADGVQCGAAPGGWYPRQQRTALRCSRSYAEKRRRRKETEVARKIKVGNEKEGDRSSQ